MKVKNNISKRSVSLYNFFFGKKSLFSVVLETGLIPRSTLHVFNKWYVRDKNLILINGNIQRSESDGTINIITFEKTSINLSGLSTKTISDPKIQEISTYEIISCMSLQFLKKDTSNCRYGESF